MTVRGQFTLSFQAYGLTLVSFADFGFSLTEQGPVRQIQLIVPSEICQHTKLHEQSKRRAAPRSTLYQRHPVRLTTLLGSPLIHMMTGSSFGVDRDSKK